MTQTDTTPTFCPANHKEWRDWLKRNHKSNRAVWLIFYKKKTNIPSIEWSDAVDQALCFGWIDGKRLSLSDEQFKQLFTKRKPKSTWSRINKAKVERLIESRQMTKAGLEAIEVSKKNGSWNILDDAEDFRVPKDLAAAFKKKSGARKSFSALSPSVRKFLLMKLTFAKRPETREARINEIMALAVKKPVKSSRKRS